jgi:D-alanyl-lipoteichoic acid acyltransferase DltB (MBOAT superfamily)
MADLIRDLFRYDPQEPLLFTSGKFLFWFCVFFVALLWLRRSGRARIGLLALFSCFFYYKCSGAALTTLLFTALADYAISRRLAATSDVTNRRRWLWLSIALSGGLLVYFKYTGMLLGGWARLSGARFEPLDVVVPAGISFYTFETISYVVDVYRGRLAPARSFVEYLAYLAYFPHLMAGPIMRAEQLLPGLRRAPELSAGQLGSGLFFVLSGLLKKAVVADYLGRYADTVFGGGAGLSGFELLLGVYCYALQIFCDFAGYSEIALGLGRLSGVELPVNFQAPYGASSISDFWRRWHITLGTWLRDYIYVPLGGNRHGSWRTALNLMLTMLLGGLWHGASASFVLWGGAHGALLCLERVLQGPLARLRKLRTGRRLLQLVTLHLVVALWIPFRSPELTQAAELVRRIACDFQTASMPTVLQARAPLLGMLGLGAALSALRHEHLEWLGRGFTRWPLPLRAACALTVVQLMLELQSAEVAPFLYFQF